ncbi:MAG: S1 RNA-binding domain-containing protein [Bacilli bacterium]
MPKIKNGDIIKCTVTGITDYGIFIKSENDYTGLCHISEISNDYVKDINDFVHINEIIYCQVIDVDYKTKQLRLSIKNIYYKTEDDGKRIVETRKGFLPLKEKLPIWIDEKIKEYNKK